MSTDIGELITWLREQIAQTERVARTASPGPWTLKTWPGYETVEIEDANGDDALHNGDGYRRWPSGNGEHVVLHDPRAVLAQCEAHAALLDLVDDQRDSAYGEPGEFLPDEWARVVRLLALAYQHRPGYREEWRP